MNAKQQETFDILTNNKLQLKTIVDYFEELVPGIKTRLESEDLVWTGTSFKYKHSGFSLHICDYDEVCTVMMRFQGIERLVSRALFDFKGRFPPGVVYPMEITSLDKFKDVITHEWLNFVDKILYTPYYFNLHERLSNSADLEFFIQTTRDAKPNCTEIKTFQ